MKQFCCVLAVAWLTSAFADESTLPPSCERSVYCDSELLHHVQVARIYPDSKTFVDLEMNYDENKTLSDFSKLLDETNQEPSKVQLENFVNSYFSKVGELENWTLPDFHETPKFLDGICDTNLRQFAKDINGIWPTLAKKVKPIVFEKPNQFSFVPVPHGFIIPGGRFAEIYYWDSYWTMEGLLICGMHETAKGMIENLIELLRKFGHIPNGSRWYYQERSQPPLLSAMMSIYFEATKDFDFIINNLPLLEKELDYWLETHSITFQKGDKKHTLLRFYAPSEGPRPESYYEDFMTAESFIKQEKQRIYTDIKSAAESGWDFSSRWFISKGGDNSGNLTNIHTGYIIPVDLNAIFARALQNTAYFHNSTKNVRKAARYAYLAQQWRNAIQEVLWAEKEGIWFDYDLKDNKHRKYFYSSNVAPLWQLAVDDSLKKKNGPKVVKYLRESQGLDYPGGVPVSLVKSGEQWDFPNVWPPEVSIVVNALEAIGSEESKNLALNVAQIYVRSCYKGHKSTKQMFEKYDAENLGKFGGGGEYTVQAGFGWTNGAALEFLHKYGSVLSVEDSSTEESKEAAEEKNEEESEKSRK